MTEIIIQTDQAGPIIDKNIYGQFAEHLGHCIYEGLWVGPDSPIPNTRGWRDDVIAALREIKVPVLRWPGGCFADNYHWRNGIGPRDERPVTLNTLWGGVEESNHVGTHEFFDLVELLGAEAYVNGNMGTGSPGEMADWIEYLTSDSKSELAELRRSNGRDKPFPLAYFGISNENWGAGGFMSPEYYTNLYKHWSTMLRPPWGTPVKFVASGGHGGEPIGVAEPDVDDSTRWTEYLSANIKPNFLLKFDAISFHYYAHPKGGVMDEERGASIGFPENEWQSTLQQTLRMDGFLEANREILDRNDPSGHLALYVDEWGTWYDHDPGTNPAFLMQQNTMRDAIAAALNFNVFHRHADRVRMANIAQMVNVLQAMVLTEGERILLTPTYHVFRMYQVFQGATSLPLKIETLPIYGEGELALPALSASAARDAEDRMWLAITNTDPNQAHDFSLNTADLKIAGVRGELLTADNMDSHNTYDNADVVTPKAFHQNADEAGLLLSVPAKSVLVLEVLQ